MSIVLLFSALDTIGAPATAWMAATVCAAIDLWILYMIVNGGKK